MVNFCSVFGCSNRSNRDRLSFYRFPYAPARYKESIRRATSDRCLQWLNAIKRKDLSRDKLKFARVCSAHFHSGKPAALHDKGNPDWIPSLKMGGALNERSPTNKAKSSPLSRFKRLKKRQENTSAEASITEDDSPACLPETASSSASSSTIETTSPGNSVGCQTNTTGSMMEAQEDELRCKNTMVYNLRDVNNSLTLSEESFRNDDKKTAFYTGLPSFSLLLVIVNTAYPYLSHTSLSVLTKFQQCLLFLIKLRLNLKYQDIAYRFNVSHTTASRIFHTCLEIFFVRLRHIIRWPTRQELHATMPTSFVQAFGKNVAIILDCFEVFIETPGNVMAKCQTWSTYKHHNTVKFLIGICPQGAITYISKGWGGRVSDKHLTEHCGILDRLLPGDIVMADRGFNIGEAVCFHYAQIKIPAFTRGKKQLSPLDVEQTRKIAHSRIHVERVIGTVRQKYNILKGPIPTEMLTSIGNEASSFDKTVTVACALTSVCQSVVPLD